MSFPYRNDLVLVGLLFGAVGSGLLVRSGISRPALSQEAATFLGTNPFIVKGASLLRADYVIGFAWIFLGFIASMIGTVQSVRDPVSSEWLVRLDPYLLAGAVVIALVVLSAGSLWASKKIALRRVLPELVALQWKLLATATGTVERDGVHEMYLVRGAVQPSEADRQRHLEDARRQLKQVGELVELPRRPGESDVAYAHRLRSFCARYQSRQAAHDIPVA
jgi:hypothetical protein